MKRPSPTALGNLAAALLTPTRPLPPSRYPPPKVKCVA